MADDEYPALKAAKEFFDAGGKRLWATPSNWFPVHGWGCPGCGRINDSYNGIVGEKHVGETLQCPGCDCEVEITNTHIEETIEIQKVTKSEHLPDNLF